MKQILNIPYIELMDKLHDIMMKQGEPFRARAYKKAQETIMSYSDDIISPEQLKGLPNIGPTIMEKLIEFKNTGTLTILEQEKHNPINILADIYGIGPKKSKELVDKGITSIELLRQHQSIDSTLLNDVQKIGLKYYEDIIKRIPRKEIDNYADILNSIFQKVFQKGNSKFEIVGSYRRGADNSGDIDIIITSDNPQVFVHFIDLLIQQKIITEVLSRGSTKCLVIAKIPSSDCYRRVDFLYTTPYEYPFSVLYFTGSKMFNTVMRGHALKMGFTMNEHGIYKMSGNQKSDKVDHIFQEEKDIFDFLHLEYVKPLNRNDSRSLNLLNKDSILLTTNNPNNNQNTVTNSINCINSINSINLKPRKITAKKRPKKKEIMVVEEQHQETKTTINQNNQSKDKDKDKDDEFVKNTVRNFKQNGIAVLEKLKEDEFMSILSKSNDAYYNKCIPLMTDNEYDIIKEYVEHKYPTNPINSQIGASLPIERNKVKLPYEMWSMDKIKPDTNSLATWIAKYSGPYIVSCKLDGVSGLYTTEGPNPKLYTRGDGQFGQDISHLIPYLRLPKTKNIVIRGEFIINKSVFENKYRSTFANPRNMVSGIINHKSVNDTIKDVDFVAYEVIKPVLQTVDQMEFIKQQLVVSCVMYTNVGHKQQLTNELLSQTLVEWRASCPYEMDGIIVANNGTYERKMGNPEHAFAFKMVLCDQIAEAKVVDVIWTPSKDGYLKPRVRIEPIQLGGVCIEYATGFNGAFIQQHKIGVGCIIEIIRSGDVIPYIRKVIVPAEQAKMPGDDILYKWNESHVDILLENMEDDLVVREKNITGFFRGIGVIGLSSGNISRMVKAGYDTVPKIISMSLQNLMSVDGFQLKSATKIYNSIHEQLHKASLISLMSASNMFGRGFSEKKIELIMGHYPTVLSSYESNLQKVERIAAIKGMANKTAELFVDKIPDFIEFMKNADLLDKLDKIVLYDNDDFYCDNSDNSNNNPLYGKTIIMTGYRDNLLKEKLSQLGAKIGTSVSKNTFVVLVKDDTQDNTGKLLDAKKLGVTIMTDQQFKNTYNL